MNDFFTKALEAHPDKESLLEALFMLDRSPYGAETRLKYYTAKFKSVGQNVRIGAGVKIVGAEYISLGDNVTISDGCTLIARGEGGIELGSGVRLQERVYLDTERPNGYIKVGQRVYIGTGTTLFGHVGLEIGDDCLLAQNITITPYSHRFEDKNAIIYSQGGNTRKVTIGRDCYLGMSVCVLYSADIGEGSVIGSASVVVKPIPPYSVAVGNPAKVIRKRGEEKK
ncbi:MAG: acyltransferase [Clostridia bacterium]|nr:acyltransferase [Clostridia bacterium]